MPAGEILAPATRQMSTCKLHRHIPIDEALYIYIYIYIYPPAPQGHTAVKPGCSVLVSLLSRHPAISVCSSGLWFCFLGSPVLSSLFLVVLLKAVGATEASDYRPKSGCLKSSGSGPDFPDSLSSLETIQKPTFPLGKLRPGVPNFY